MKEEYIYKNGKIKTIDYNIIKKELTYDYQDNINEILKTENIIEFLKKDKEIIKRDINNIKKQIKNNKKNIESIKNIWGFISILLTLFILKDITLFYTLFIINSCIFLTPILVFTDINRIHKKILNGNCTELEKIEKESKEYKEKLKELYENKTITETEIKKQENKVNYIKYKEELKDLKDCLRIYFCIGSNETKFKKYYDKNILDKKLNKEFNINERKLIKRYFDKEN